MFIKFSEFSDSAAPIYDVCIIGAGAAGIALARYLGSKALDVCLVESGGFEYEAETQLLYEGEISGIDYLPLDSVRLRYFGGTTNHWGGQSVPLDALDFEKRYWVDNSGWPISFEEFSRFLPQAQEICVLGPESFDSAFWLATDGMAQYPLSQSRFDPVFLRFPVPGPTRFGEVYRNDIERSENVICLLHANVTNIIANERHDHVEAIEIRNLDNSIKKVRARYVVLATGAIENCRLLLTSGNMDAGGLVNANDVVGRFFMEHPNYTSGVVVLADPRATEYLAKSRLSHQSSALRRDIRLNVTEQRRNEILNHSAFLIPQQNLQDENNLGILSRIWAKAEKLWAKFELPDTFALRVRLEHAPYAHSRVMLSETTDVFGIPRAHVRLQTGKL